MIIPRLAARSLANRKVSAVLTIVSVALSVVLVNVETPRFRAPVDPFLALLAACALVSWSRGAGLMRG